MKTLAAVALLAGCAVALSAQPNVIAITGVTVIPMDRERVLETHTVIVQDGRIAALGPAASTTAPAGATVVDGKGKFLIPGLSDMHGHLPPLEGTNDDAASQFMKLYLANGVTTVRGMQGHANNLVLRDKLARAVIPGPLVYAAGPALHGKSAPTPDEGKKAVEEQKAAGFDLLKVHEGLSPETYEAITATARQLGIKVGGHVTATVGLQRALAARQSSIEHLDGYLQALVPDDSPDRPLPGQVQFGPALQRMDESRMAGLAKATRDAGVYNNPTLALFQIVVSSDAPDTYLQWPEMKYVAANLRGFFAKQKAGTAGLPAPPEDRRRYVELRNKMVKALSDAGAKLLVGPDSPQMFLVPGFATHREMAALAGAGLSPFAVLSAATTSAAEYLGTATEAGTIAAGKRADLVLVNANPLQDIGNAQKIEGVMVRGKWFPRAELDRMLAALAEAHKTQ